MPLALTFSSFQCCSLCLALAAPVSIPTWRGSLTYQLAAQPFRSGLEDPGPHSPARERLVHEHVPRLAASQRHTFVAFF